MLLQLCLLMIISYLSRTEGVVHGRNARPGEFPYVVRIQISETSPSAKIEDGGSEWDSSKWDEWREDSRHSKNASRDQSDKNYDHDAIQDDDQVGAVSAGVLITMSRVLTTCDSVGFFTGQKVNLYSLSKVSVMAGTVNKSGAGGQTMIPSKSNVHPYCYFLTTKMSVLFNYGIYEFSTPFRSLMDGNVALIKPISNFFKSTDDMQNHVLDLTSGKSVLECYAAGWGNYKKEFEGSGMPDYFERFSETLQIISMKIIDFSDCYESTCEFFDECLISIWESGYVCAKAEDGGPCNEDNGAPLICADQVFGVLVDPRRCTNTGIARHFLRVDLAYNYIFDVKSLSCVNHMSRYSILVGLLTVGVSYITNQGSRLLR